MGVESGALPDTALSASSSYDPLNVGPQHARLGQVNRAGDRSYHIQWKGDISQCLK